MTEIPKSPFVLVDGSSYLFRAYYALPPLTNSTGQPTGAIYGVINMLKKLLTTYQPQYIAVVFDTKEKTFRHDKYPEYKANRTAMPDELAAQIKPLHEIIRAMGLPLLAVPGVEADDVIGTLARQAEAKKMFTVISTGDKDMAQLVDNQTVLINTMTDTLMDQAGVVDKFQVPPHQIIDYLTLIGDTVDNIPGVPKVGPKTAVKWLNTYGSLDDIIQHHADIKGKVGENLKNALDDLPLYKELITIKTDVELACQPEELLPTPRDIDKLTTLFATLEFKNWLKDLDGSAISGPPVAANDAVILTTQDLNQWLQKLKNSTLFAVDTETTSLDPQQAELVGVSLAVNTNEAAYIPLGHDYEGAPLQLDKQAVLTALKPFLEGAAWTKVGHHLKYDAAIFARNGIQLQAPWMDTMLESYVYNSTASRHDMDSLARHYLQITTTSFEDVAGKGVKQLTFNQVPLEQAAPYAAEDARVTLSLHEFFWPSLAKNDGLRRVYEEIEMPLMPVLQWMEQHGVLIDAKELEKQSKDLQKRLEKLESEAFAKAGAAFNLNSPKQLQEILFEQMGLPVTQTTPTGQPSTSEAVLQVLARDFPLPKIILEYRSLAKLKSTYTDKLPQQINPRTGRVHTSYHQAVTATGRLSSSDPNLQNIPIRTQEGRKVRDAFIAPKGSLIVSADYSQIELRIMAHLSADETLKQAFADQLDIHRLTASEVFATPYYEVTDLQRRHAKAINFGLMYGMSAFGLAEQLGIERREADSYIEFYFERFPGVLAYMESTRAKAKKQGYVETLFGRRLYLPDINAKHVGRRRAAERAAINAPLQGAQADIIKLAMVQIHDWIQKDSPEVALIMQVHDELIFEVPESMLDASIERVAHLMENAAKLSVPLHVTVGSGQSWGEAH